MKYIRTKDGRIITFSPKEKYENDKATFEWFVANYCGGGINVLKQADTIEELCDYIMRKPVGSVDDRVFILKKIIHKGYLNRNNYEEIKEELKQQYKMQKNGDKAIIYLAIETDKGLIYVAKMNDKGELELL